MRVERERYHLYYFSPKPNILIVFSQAASVSTSRLTPLIAATAHPTLPIIHGSFRPLTIAPSTHFSFFPHCNSPISSTNSALAWLGRISHHGPSVSNCSLSNGTFLTTSIFSF